MAAPTKTAGNPVRTLVILGAVIAALAAWAFIPTPRTPKLGLDLQGGSQVILTPVSATGAPVTDEELQQTKEILDQRINGAGVAESEIQIQGSGNNAAIIVSIPGVTNQEILNSLATTAKLEFRAVLQETYGAPVPTPTITPSPSGSVSPAPSASASTTLAPVVGVGMSKVTVKSIFPPTAELAVVGARLTAVAVASLAMDCTLADFCAPPPS